MNITIMKEGHPLINALLKNVPPGGGTGNVINCFTYLLSHQV